MGTNFLPAVSCACAYLLTGLMSPEEEEEEITSFQPHQAD